MGGETVNGEWSSVQARSLTRVDHLARQVTVTRGSDELTGTLRRIEHGCERVEVTRLTDAKEQFVDGRPWVRITVDQWGIDVELDVDEWVKVRL
jgi:hypothetical protein